MVEIIIIIYNNIDGKVNCNLIQLLLPKNKLNKFASVGYYKDLNENTSCGLFDLRTDCRPSYSINLVKSKEVKKF